MADTIAAIATGAQVAAIGIIRISGPGAVVLANGMFVPFRGKPLKDRADRTLVYGRLVNRAGDTLDICLATVSRGPNSYTGEATAEFQCHGSPALLRAVLEELFSLGARQALPGEFTKRAFLNGRMELSSAEAVADIIDAETAESVINAAGQLGGAISLKIGDIYSSLGDISSHYHAVLDYPDEDIEDFVLEGYRDTLQSAEKELCALLSTFDRGKFMRSGIPAAIAGLPNVGKSSLLNLLLGYDRAIVTDVPGTTRDTIDEKVILGGVNLRLTDTAGIHETDDPVEKFGVQRSRQALEDAQLVIAVLDGTRPYTREDLEIIKAAENAAAGILVISKADIEAEFDLPETKLPTVHISSVTGRGLRSWGTL